MTDVLPTDPAALQALLVAERAAHAATQVERDTARVGRRSWNVAAGWI